MNPVVSKAQGEAFAREWADAWNSGDLDRILSHYSDDFEMRSPLMVELGFSDDGALRGKDAIRSYWEKGMAVDPPIRFELLGVYCGVGAVAIHYRSLGRAKQVVERIELSPDGKGLRAEGLYMDELS